MSSVIKCDTKTLKRCLEFISLMIPKGNETVPLGISSEKGVLTLTCVQGAIYQCKIPELNSTISHCTCLYSDIAQLLEGEFTEIEVSQHSVNIESKRCSITLLMGYSTVEEVNISLDGMHQLTPVAYIGLRNLTNLGLDKIYKKSIPIQIFNDVSLLKYPNTYVQVHSNGFGCERYIDTEHVKMLCRFAPTNVSTKDINSFTFTNNDAILQIPCREVVDGSTIVPMLEGMKSVCTVHLDGYVDRVRNASKVCRGAHCKITFTSKSINTTISTSDVSLTVSTGEDGDIKKVCHLPIEVWMTFLKVLNGGMIEVLIGGDNICLRNQEYVIVTRALL